MNVLKFGGTSVGSPQAILSLLKIVKQESAGGKRLIVVCSAMNGVTQSLLQLLDDAAKGKEFEDALTGIENRHYDTVRKLLETRRHNPALLGLKIFFNELDSLLTGIRAIGEITPRVRDKVLSYGELLSCFMITHCINQHCASAFFTDTRPIIKTDSEYGNANVMEEPTQANIREHIQSRPEQIFVFTGFIASDNNGETTTLGRGGSDYTAAIAGAAINTALIQIWTDVDGIMSADPRMVKKAFSIPELSYVEAIELSYFGARVIYPPTMIPAQSRNIPILIRNTFNRAFKGTLIGPSTTENGSLIKGISFIPQICLLTVQGSGMVGYTGFSRRLFRAFANASVNVILITQASSEHSITLAINPEDRIPAINHIHKEFEQELQLGKISPPMVESNYSIIAVVGEKMRHTRGLSGRLFSALGRSGVNVVAIAQGSSELNISTVIDQEDLSKAMNSIHDSMFLSPVKTLNVFCCGIGNIGNTLLRQIRNNHIYLQENRQVRINLAGVCNSRRMLINPDGIPLENWEAEFSKNAMEADVYQFRDEAIRLNLSNPVFIDNTGSPLVAGLYPGLFRESISVVACNKIGVSGTQSHYTQSKESARNFGVDYWYETAVGAGLPIIKTISDLLISGDRIMKIEAILSGTISFIFNNYREDRTFAEVVKEAQNKGFTEPDPRDDLSGLDFARKMLILARETGLQVEMEDISMEPILPENCMKAPNIEGFYKELIATESYFQAMKEKAASENKAMHLVGTLSDEGVSIKLLMLDEKHPFYNLSGSDNIISITTNRYFHNPMVIKGPGAGAEVTAAGVMADLIKVAAEA